MQNKKLIVVSITCSYKKEYTDPTSKNLRALNLAAFELVDYVIVDKNAEPYELLNL